METIQHKCDKEREISEMHEMMTRIDKALRGNGKPGLFTEFAVWKNTVLGILGLNVLILTGLIGLWLSK